MRGAQCSSLRGEASAGAEGFPAGFQKLGKAEPSHDASAGGTPVQEGGCTGLIGSSETGHLLPPPERVFKEELPSSPRAVSMVVQGSSRG